MTTWFVTGASRGFGAALVEVALANGHDVVAAARRPEQVQVQVQVGQPGAGKLLPVQLDVTDGEQITSAVAAAVDRFGGIDVLVNNAGRGLVGALEEISDAEGRELYDLNVFAVMNMTRAVLPTMRAQRSGRIVTMGSAAGINGSAGATLYSSSKFALEGFTESLDAELAPFGIRAVVIEPGFFRTDFLDPSSMRRAARSMPEYRAGLGERLAALAGANHTQPGDPRKAAQLIHDLVSAEEVPARLPIGADAVGIVEAKAHRVLDQIGPWRERSLATAHPR